MTLVRNERIKLAATYLNGAAMASLAIGGIGQVVAIGFASSVAGVAVWTLISLLLHLAAQVTLGSLRE